MHVCWKLLMQEVTKKRMSISTKRFILRENIQLVKTLIHRLEKRTQDYHIAILLYSEDTKQHIWGQSKSVNYFSITAQWN